MILKVFKIARAFGRVQFENFQNHEYLLFTNCTRRSCDFLFIVHSTKLHRFHGNMYSYGVQFGINYTALDQSILSNFVECTINILQESFLSLKKYKHNRRLREIHFHITPLSSAPYQLPFYNSYFLVSLKWSLWRGSTVIEFPI